jgi:hypothetical protein
MWEIRWEPWSEQHIAAHGVSPGDVEEVVYARPRLVGRGRDQTTLVWGRTAAGRHLLVVLAADHSGSTSFVVTARDMTAREKAAFKARAR